MFKRWKELSKGWVENSVNSDEHSRWAIEPINSNESLISSLEDNLIALPKNDLSVKDLEEELKNIRRLIKNELTAKENQLDNLTLNTPNSYKLQLSVPSNLNYLMKAWAASEGRDLSSVALQCMEAGLRELKSKGSIPQSAITRYDIACEKRVALAEANDLWGKHEHHLTELL